VETTVFLLGLMDPRMPLLGEVEATNDEGQHMVVWVQAEARSWMKVSCNNSGVEVPVLPMAG